MSKRVSKIEEEQPGEVIGRLCERCGKPILNKEDWAWDNKINLHHKTCGDYDSIFEAINAGKYKNKMDWKENHKAKEESKKNLTELGGLIFSYYEMLERSGQYQASLHPIVILEEIKNLMVIVSSELEIYDKIKLQEKSYNAEDRRLEALFKSDLEKEHGVENNPKKDLLYSIAWEEGHSAGYYEVAIKYDDLVELIK
jgi:hypothetical protein